MTGWGLLHPSRARGSPCRNLTECGTFRMTERGRASAHLQAGRWCGALRARAFPLIYYKVTVSLGTAGAAAE